ncbi:MAG: tetratricopeptide repeat protein [Proteobacteria bacterium]|nr:tetratricopeptide repeat protein [Pseudomonadota bacterium]
MTKRWLECLWGWVGLGSSCRISDLGVKTRNCALPQNCKRLQGTPDARNGVASYTLGEQPHDKAEGVPCDRLPCRRMLCAIAGLVFLLLCQSNQGWGHVTDANMPDAVAETEYQILLEFQPEQHEVRNKLGMVLLRKKKYVEAEAEFSTVLKSAPENFNAIDGLGLVMSRTGREKEAVEQFLKAIRINSQDVMVHYHLGLAHAALGDYLAAEKAYRQAITQAEQPSAVSLPKADLSAIRKALETNTVPPSIKE